MSQPSTMYCHATAAYDGEKNAPDYPIIIKEHIFTILEDSQHDKYTAQKIKAKINHYNFSHWIYCDGHVWLYLWLQYIV